LHFLSRLSVITYTIYVPEVLSIKAHATFTLCIFPLSISPHFIDDETEAYVVRVLV
jgi:hypothetical protein